MAIQMYSPAQAKSADPTRNKLGDLADWWIKQKNETYQTFADWAHANRDHIVFSYGISALGVGTGMAMELGTGYIDVLKLGHGIQKGTWSGIGTDGLRLLSLAGNVGNAKKVAGAGMARVYTNLFPEQPVCSYISTAQAFRHSGNRLFVTLEDLARAQGVSLNRVFSGTQTALNKVTRSGRQSSGMASVYRSLGVSATPVVVSTVGSHTVAFDLLSNFLRQASRGTVMPVSLKFMNAAGQELGHHQIYLYLWRNTVRIMDRTGSFAIQNASGLIKEYSRYGVARMEVIGAALIHAPGFIRYGNWLSVGIPMVRKLAGSLFQLESSYKIWKATRANGTGGVANALSPILPSMGISPPSQNQSLPRTYTTSMGDSLWSLAHTYLGTGMRWPQLYNRNKSIIGRDPAYLPPGTKLVLP